MNTNFWRQLNYTLMAPIYDRLTSVFHNARARSLQLAAPQPHERVLLVGAGTGLDLPFLPQGPAYTAIDITPSMLRRLEQRARRLGLTVDARVMDGMNMQLDDASFDLVVLHLILAVIPDPRRCLDEAARVLRPGGRAVVFDKFVPPGRRSMALRVLNPLASLLGTNVDRSFEPLIAGGPWAVVADQPAFLAGYFRHILLHRTP